MRKIVLVYYLLFSATLVQRFLASIKCVIGVRFNLSGHSKNYVKFTIIKQVRSQDPLYEREREMLHIRNICTFYVRINKEP